MSLATESGSQAVSYLVKIGIVIGTVVILYYGATLLIPLTFATMIAMLIMPIVKWLIRKGTGEFVAISLAALLVVFVVGGLFALIAWQSATMSESMSVAQEKFDEILATVQRYISANFDISKTVQDQKLATIVADAQAKVMAYTGEFTLVLSDWFLTFVYLIVILMERKRFEYFILKLFASERNIQLKSTIGEVNQTVRDYLYGQLLVTAVLGVAYAIGFLIAGLKFSILIAIIAAILTFIPYLGNIIGAILVVLAALVSGLSVEALLLILVYLTVVQVVESYILKPWIIGNEISLNIFAVIVSVVAFSLIWGIAGSIIALPLASILRILCSKIESLRPYEYLLSDMKVVEYEDHK